MILRTVEFHGKALTRLARESTDMFEFGRKAHALFGDAIQLSEWSAALSLRGAGLLENVDAGSTFKAHFLAAAQTVRSFLATLLARRPDLGSFRSLSEQIDALSCPDNFKFNCWDVIFNRALSVAAPLFKQWQATPDEMAAVQDAISADDLAHRLAAAGVNVELDPIDLARGNRERLRHALHRLQQIGLAWALEKGIPNPESWESRVDRYLDYLSLHIETIAFTSVWSEENILELLRKLPIDDEKSADLWALLAVASSSR